VLKLKTILITDGNKARIWSKLNKFFSHSAYTKWHTYDCGMRKRIRHKMPGSSNTMEYYPCVKAKLSDEDTFVISLNVGSSRTIKVGDSIAFVGNRIIVKTKWWGNGEYSWLYWCCQIGFPSSKYHRK
jgi:hypothetical protein